MNEDFIFERISGNFEYDLEFKIALVGDCKVGKTFLIEKAKGTLLNFDDYNSTNGFDVSFLGAKVKGRK